MDDQRQDTPDLSPKKARPRRKASPPSPTTGQPPAQPGQTLPAQLAPEQKTKQAGSTSASPRPTRQSPAPPSNATRQLPQPQPILFPGSEGEMEASGNTEEALLRRQRLLKVRRWLRSRPGRIVVPLLTLLIGLAVGLGAILWYGLSGAVPVILGPQPAQGNLIIEADKNFVTELVAKDLANAGLPGQVENVKVNLVRGSAMTVQGDDVYTLLGVTFSRHFTVDVQLYVRSCIMQVRVTRADLGGIPVTGFVQNFEGNINKELAQKPGGLPEGFTYCTVGVRTEPAGLFLTYRAVAVK